MRRELFPLLQPETAGSAPSLPLYREVAWDFERDIPIYREGSPVFVEGEDAVLVWAWRALHTDRFRYPVYTWDFGNEIGDLIGQAFSDDLKRAESIRYVREALLVNPYIEDVTETKVAFAEDRLTVSCKIKTIYGEVEYRG